MLLLLSPPNEPTPPPHHHHLNSSPLPLPIPPAQEPTSTPYHKKIPSYPLQNPNPKKMCFIPGQGRTNPRPSLRQKTKATPPITTSLFAAQSCPTHLIVDTHTPDCSDRSRISREREPSEICMDGKAGVGGECLM